MRRLKNSMKCQYFKVGKLLLITLGFFFLSSSLPPLFPFDAGRQLVFFKVASNHIVPDPDKITYVKVTD